MKKLSLCFLWVLSAMVLPAEENKISMVTYFPVPYVAYNRVQAAQEMDIGLTENGGNLSLGTASSSVPLSVSDTTKVTVGNLNLAFNSATIETDRYINFTDTATPLSLGVANYPDSADLFFKNLRIKAVSNSATGTANGQGISSINTDELVVNGLTLFGKSFPNCASVNPDSNGNGQIAWKTLTLGPSGDGASVYLTCGGSQTCPLLKPLDKQACQVNEWVSSLSNTRLRSLYESGVVSSSLWDYCFLGAICNYSAMRFNLQNKEGTDYLLCGNQTKNYECNLDANPPAWQSDSSWDYSGCQTQRIQEKTVVSSCYDYFAAHANNMSSLNGWTVEGDVYRIVNYTKDANGFCQAGVPVISTGSCVAAKYAWGAEELVSTGTQYVNPTSYYDQVVWSLQHPSSSGMYVNGGHSACWHIRECNEGYSEASCSSSSDVGTTRQHVKGGSTGTSTKCQVWRHRYYTGPNGQQMDNPWHDSAADFNATVYSCNTYRETCKKRCRDVRMYDDDPQVYFVNSERDCN